MPAKKSKKIVPLPSSRRAVAKLRTLAPWRSLNQSTKHKGCGCGKRLKIMNSIS